MLPGLAGSLHSGSPMMGSLGLSYGPFGQALAISPLRMDGVNLSAPIRAQLCNAMGGQPRRPTKPGFERKIRIASPRRFSLRYRRNESTTHSLQPAGPRKRIATLARGPGA